MKAKQIVFGVVAFAVVAAVVSVSVYTMPSNKPPADAVFPKPGSVGQATAVANSGELEAGPKEAVASSETGTMLVGSFPGNVSYDSEKDHFFLELRGVRFPFKTSPKTALEVELEAPGKDDLEKNTALLYGMIGPEVLHATVLINPDEEDEVMPAATDLARYIRIVNPRKFAGIAYTKEGGKIQRSVVKGSPIQSLDKDADPTTPLILLKGPQSGATSTKVRVLDGGSFVIEGKTYEDLYKAADFVCITLIKMLCGSSDCPNAAACATGGDCGCG